MIHKNVAPSLVKSLQDSQGAAFVYDWQPPLIFLPHVTYCTAHAQEVSGKSDKD